MQKKKKKKKENVVIEEKLVWEWSRDKSQRGKREVQIPIMSHMVAGLGCSSRGFMGTLILSFNSMRANIRLSSLLF